MNAITKRTRQMATILAQHENDLSSFVSKANERIDNLMQGVKENNLAINYVQGQLQETTENLECMFQQMNGLLSKQIKISSHINHELDELTNLVNGKLSPLLILKAVLESTFRDIQNIKFPGFHLTQPSPTGVYASSNFLYARNETSLFITVKLPVSHFKEPLQVYNVISLPVPINSTSAHTTHLLKVPQNFIITVDHQFYATMTDPTLNKCKGPFNIALTPITKESCILALFANIKTLCDFRFVPNAVQPELLEINPYSLVLYKTPIPSLECHKEHKMIKGCNFCIVQLPCQCSATSVKPQD